MPEPSPKVLARFRKLIGQYHAECEELTRVLAALEAAGLRTYSVKKVERTHYLLERYLELLDRDEFGSETIGTLVEQFEDGRLSSYGPDDAFERPSGRAIAQMRKVEAAWTHLHTYVFGLDADPIDADPIEVDNG